MKNHKFNIFVAAQVGINAALIFELIAYWTERNQIERRNIYKGKAWYFTTAKALTSIYPYMSEGQIKSALRKLRDAGLIESGGLFRSVNGGRGTIYTLTERGANL